MVIILFYLSCSHHQWRSCVPFPDCRRDKGRYRLCTQIERARARAFSPLAIRDGRAFYWQSTTIVHDHARQQLCFEFSVVACRRLPGSYVVLSACRSPSVLPSSHHQATCSLPTHVLDGCTALVVVRVRLFPRYFRSSVPPSVVVVRFGEINHR